MRNCFMGSIVAVVTVLALAPVLLAQTSNQPGGTKAQPTDLTGVWGSPAWGNETRMSPAELARQASQERERPPLPMQKWAEEKFIYNADPNRMGTRGRIELDTRNRCFPPNPIQIMSDSNPFEIILAPKRLLIFSETNREVRQIWLDGRGHPDDLELSWMGHSIGKWDGDTLVVDTVGITDRGWLDGAGHIHTDALHIVERFRRADRDTLEIDVTFEDAKAYTKPWTQKIIRKWRADWEITPSVQCDERYKMGIYGDTY